MDLDKLICKENLDVDEYFNYFINVKNEMDNPLWLGDLEKEDFKYILNSGAKSWTFFKDNEFVCSIMFIAATKHAIEKLELNYEEKECGECGPTFVSKKFRGNNLQFQMLKILEDYCRTKNLKYILTTAHPDNIYSWKNMEKAGYQKENYLVLKRGPRNIYVKHL